MLLFYIVEGLLLLVVLFFLVVAITPEETLRRLFTSTPRSNQGYQARTEIRHIGDETITGIRRTSRDFRDHIDRETTRR